MNIDGYVLTDINATPIINNIKCLLEILFIINHPSKVNGKSKRMKE